MNAKSVRVRWHREYISQGIPSSFRDEPSGSTVLFNKFLHHSGVCKGRLLDIGCGRGRNSIFFAEEGFVVDSVDFVPQIISDLEMRITALNLVDKVHPRCHDVTKPWPFPDASFDCAIDTFCYKHQIDEKDKALYRRELSRVLKPGGYYLLTLAGADDGYYGPLLKESPDQSRHVILDPANGIESILYSRCDVEKEFDDFMDVKYYKHKAQEGVMHGKAYPRSTHLFIFAVTAFLQCGDIPIQVDPGDQT